MRDFDSLLYFLFRFFTFSSLSLLRHLKHPETGVCLFFLYFIIWTVCQITYTMFQTLEFRSDCLLFRPADKNYRANIWTDVGLYSPADHLQTVARQLPVMRYTKFMVFIKGKREKNWLKHYLPEQSVLVMAKVMCDVTL